MEYMPEYPIDKPDSDGNTPLLLAYIKVSNFKRPNRYHIHDTNIMIN